MYNEAESILFSVFFLVEAETNFPKLESSIVPVESIFVGTRAFLFFVLEWKVPREAG